MESGCNLLGGLVGGPPRVVAEFPVDEDHHRLRGFGIKHWQGDGNGTGVGCEVPLAATSVDLPRSRGFRFKGVVRATKHVPIHRPRGFDQPARAGRCKPGVNTIQNMTRMTLEIMRTTTCR